MTRSRRVALLGAVSLVLLVAAGCGSNSQAQSRPNLPSLGLRLSDLPSQTTKDGAGFSTVAQAARRNGIPPAVYGSLGHVASYQGSFSRNVMNGAGLTWLLHADSQITAFKDSAQAHWYLDRTRRAWLKTYVMSTNNLGANAGQTGIHNYFHRLAIPSVGAAHAAFTVDSGGDEMGFTTRVIFFQRGPYVVMLRVRGLLDQTPVSRVMTVAQKIDARVKRVT